MISKERLDFEAWVKSLPGHSMMLGLEDNPRRWRGDTTAYDANPYQHPWTNGAFEAWKFLNAPKEPPADDGWIEWSGGEQPVGDNVEVEVQFRDGSNLQEKAGYFSWEHHKESFDIVAYRVIKGKDA